MKEEIEMYAIFIGIIAVIIFALTRGNIDTNSLLIGMALVGLPLRLLILYKNETFANRIAWELNNSRARFEESERDKADDFMGTKENTYPMENENFLIPERFGVWLSKEHDLWFYNSDFGPCYSKDSFNFYGKASGPPETYNLKRYLSSGRFIVKLNKEGYFKEEIEKSKSLMETFSQPEKEDE
jgi:hypothetical protein